VTDRFGRRRPFLINITIDWSPTFGGANLSMVWMGPAG
jgi:hypothetical protein